MCRNIGVISLYFLMFAFSGNAFAQKAPNVDIKWAKSEENSYIHLERRLNCPLEMGPDYFLEHANNYEQLPDVSCTYSSKSDRGFVTLYFYPEDAPLDMEIKLGSMPVLDLKAHNAPIVKTTSKVKFGSLETQGKGVSAKVISEDRTESIDLYDIEGWRYKARSTYYGNREKVDGLISRFAEIQSDALNNIRKCKPLIDLRKTDAVIYKSDSGEMTNTLMGGLILTAQKEEFKKKNQTSIDAKDRFLHVNGCVLVVAGSDEGKSDLMFTYNIEEGYSLITAGDFDLSEVKILNSENFLKEDKQSTYILMSYDKDGISYYETYASLPSIQQATSLVTDVLNGKLDVKSRVNYKDNDLNIFMGAPKQ